MPHSFKNFCKYSHLKITMYINGMGNIKVLEKRGLRFIKFVDSVLHASNCLDFIYNTI